MSESKVETWRARVADWRASGETAEEFCARQGLIANTLRWWVRRLERKYGDAPPTKIDPERSQPRRSRRSKRVEVRLAKVIRKPAPPIAALRHAAIAIELHDVCARITVESGADQKTLATVLAVVAAHGKQ